MYKSIKVTPRPKPRMNKADAWKKRPCVLRYWEYAAELRKHEILKTVDWNPLSVTFLLPMPKSWSKKKKVEMVGTKHEQKPDLSNLVKAFEDILLKDDSKVWCYWDIMKLWDIDGMILVNCKEK